MNKVEILARINAVEIVITFNPVILDELLEYRSGVRFFHRQIVVVEGAIRMDCVWIKIGIEDRAFRMFTKKSIITLYE